MKKLIASLSFVLGIMASPILAQEFSDENVEAAIKKGVEYLLSAQQGASWEPYGQHGGKPYTDGTTAMATYALIEAGISPVDKRITAALEWLKTNRTDFTYCLALRCLAFNAANRETKNKYLEPLQKDGEQLIAGTPAGGYTYECKAPEKPLDSTAAAGAPYDHSNSQYGLLGVWALMMSHPEVPREYWAKVMTHWQNTQCADGGWSYRDKNEASTGTMAGAGLASMFVCFDYLMSDSFVKCAGGMDYAPIKRGLDYFDKNFAQNVAGANLGFGDEFYYLYGVERVGLASGYKYFNKLDWYKAGASVLLKTQQGDGSWPGKFCKIEGTAYALLFLVRGRQAVLFNKLEYTGDWNNRPRALASATRWISSTFENVVNWQIINLQTPVAEWHDAPIIVMSGSKAPTFTDAELDKLREYVQQGGTLLSLAECTGTPFSKEMEKVYHKLFPDYELVPMGPKHPIYEFHFNVRGKPKLSMVSNGVRPLAIHCDEDIMLSWQLRNLATQKYAFEAAANIYMYMTDKATMLHARGTSPWPVLKGTEDTPTTVKVARLKTTGNYDPEPLAYKRFALMMTKYAKTKVDLVGPIDIKELAASGAQLASIVGTDSFSLKKEEKDALKAWVAGGGTLLFDAAGGSDKFATAAENLVAELWGAESLRTLASSHPMYKPGNSLDLDKVKYRRATAIRAGASKAPMLRAVLVKDRPAVIVSREDIVAGLAGVICASVDGYHPGDARNPQESSCFRLMRNITLFAGGGMKPAAAEPTAAAAPAAKSK